MVVADFEVSLRSIGGDDASKSSTKIAFGSCHKSKYADPQIWKSIMRETPDAFLWTGDAVYPPVRGLASLELLEAEYDRMTSSIISSDGNNIGYSDFLQTHTPVFGTWDDHDYGGNDMGYEMPDKEQRAAAYWKFLDRSPPDPKRSGLYYSVRFTANAIENADQTITQHQQNDDQSILVIFLDTRWHRKHHCIRSMAGSFPLGAGVACVTRGLSAGLFPQYCSHEREPFPLLGSEQWDWLQRQLDPPSLPPVVVIISSIQVTTTNPVFESWGHFPSERDRLLNLLMQASKHASVSILSGDVHFGEILDPFPEDPSHNAFLEITSSGLTHTCGKHVYGPMCEPLLKWFHRHRFRGKLPIQESSNNNNNDNYYTGRNYGTLQVDWENQTVTVNVHDVTTGTVMLTTGARSWNRQIIDQTHQQKDWNAKDVRSCMDGHLIPIFWTFLLALGLAICMKKYSTVHPRHAPK